MKPIVPILVISLSCLIGQTASAALYTFDNLDSTPSGNPGTLVGNATIAGGSLDTTGGGYFELPDSAVNIGSSFFIEQVYTANSLTANFSTLFTLSNGTDDYYIIAVARRGGSTDLSVAFESLAGGEVLLTAPAPALGVETTLRTTYDHDTGAIALFLNGVLVDSDTLGANRITLSDLTNGEVAGSNGQPFADPSLNGTTSSFEIGVIPEPTALGLLGIGGGLFGLRRRRA